MIWENIFIHLPYFYSHFLFYIHYNTLKQINDKVAKGTYSFMSLIVKIMSLGLVFILSVPAADKTQSFVYSSLHSAMQLINGISRDLQKLLKYFNGTAIAVLFRIPLALFIAGWPPLLSNNLALYLKDLKSSVFSMLLLKPVVSSFEKSHKPPH